MNAPLRHPQEAASAVSLPWTAVIQPCMGLNEPVMLAGHPAVWNSPGTARAYASVHPGMTTIFIGWSPKRPSVERIREVANPEPLPPAPATFDITSLDPWKEQEQYHRAQGTGSNSAWGR